MPRYDYECGECKKKVELFHSMHETISTCPLCGVRGKFRKHIPQFSKLDRTGPPVGRIVDSHIQEAKKEIEEHKREMKKEME